MKWIVVGQLIFVLVFIAIFGAFGIHNGHHGYFQCVASLINGAQAPCPENDPLGFISFHASAFSYFSLAILVAVALFSLAVALSWSSLNLWQRRASHPRFFENKPALSQKSHNFLSWFSRHENSPPFSFSVA